MKRLVVAPNWLGDCVMALPVLRALRASDTGGAMTILAGRAGAPVFRMADPAARIVELPRSIASQGRLALSLRRETWDEAWVLPHSFRSALLAWLSGASRRYGYRSDGRRALLTHAPARPAPVRHQVRDYDRLLDAGGVAPDLEPPGLSVSPDMLERAARLLDVYHLREAGPPFLVAPGAAFGATKRWPAERFALLADALMDEGRRAAIAVGPGEIALGRLVARRARHRIPVLGEDLDTGELAALFAQSALLIGNDSGPAHLAAAVGTPVLAFFGPTDPGRTAPLGARTRILDRFLHCSPCYRRTCPYEHECMEEITVSEAHRAARDLLEK